MRIVASEDERNLWKMVKPYLKPEGLALVFDEDNAPANIKKRMKNIIESTLKHTMMLWWLMA